MMTEELAAKAAVTMTRGRALPKEEIVAAPAGETIAWGWMRPHPRNGMPFGSIWRAPDQAKEPEKSWKLIPVEVRKASPHARGEVGYFDLDDHCNSLVGIIWNHGRPSDVTVQVVVVEPAVEG
jgi:hypothetical protein